MLIGRAGCKGSQVGRELECPVRTGGAAASFRTSRPTPRRLPFRAGVLSLSKTGSFGKCLRCSKPSRYGCGGVEPDPGYPGHCGLIPSEQAVARPGESRATAADRRSSADCRWPTGTDHPVGPGLLGRTRRPLGSVEVRPRRRAAGDCHPLAPRGVRTLLAAEELSPTTRTPSGGPRSRGPDQRDGASEPDLGSSPHP